jgi:CRP-like cAMP-binding protein
MQYEVALAGSYVLHHGDPGDKFYIIIEGEAEVQIPGPDSKKPFIKIADLNSGQSFGELALLKGQPRMASIYCRTACHLATLSKQDYNKILRSVFERQLEHKIKFLSSMLMFRDWTQMSLTKLSYYFRERKLGRKCTLYREGALASKIFVIVKGDLKVFKTYSTAVEDSARISPRQLIKNQRLDLAIISSGEFLGIEGLMESGLYTNSCESLSPVDYYEIKASVRTMQEFEARVMSQPTFSLLKSRIEFTSRLRKTRFDVFSRQAIEVKRPEVVGRPEDSKNKEELLTKSLRGYTKIDSSVRPINRSTRLEHRQRRRLTPQKTTEQDQLILTDLQTSNRPSQRKMSPTIKRSVSLRRLQQIISRSPSSVRLTQLKQSSSLQRVGVVPSLLLDHREVTEFAFMNIGSMTPHKNIWEERQMRSCRTPRILRVSPRY